DIGGVDLPIDGPLQVGPGDLRDRISREMHADTVIFGGPPQDRWFSTIVEVETEMSDNKLRQTVEAAETPRLETRTSRSMSFSSLLIPMRSASPARWRSAAVAWSSPCTR